MVTEEIGMDEDFDDPVTDRNQQRWQDKPLTDAEYVGGKGSPFNIDRNVLMFAPWRLSNNQYDRSLAFAGHWRYRPVLTYFVRLDNPTPGFARDRDDKLRKAKHAYDNNGELKKDWSLVKSSFDPSHELVTVGSLEVNAQRSKVYSLAQEEWNSQTFPKRKRNRKELKIIAMGRFLVKKLGVKPEEIRY